MQFISEIQFQNYYGQQLLSFVRICSLILFSIKGLLILPQILNMFHFFLYFIILP